MGKRYPRVTGGLYAGRDGEKVALLRRHIVLMSFYGTFSLMSTGFSQVKKAPQKTLVKNQEGGFYALLQYEPMIVIKKLGVYQEISSLLNPSLTSSKTFGKQSITDLAVKDRLLLWISALDFFKFAGQEYKHPSFVDRMHQIELSLRKDLTLKQKFMLSFIQYEMFFKTAQYVIAKKYFDQIKTTPKYVKTLLNL